MKKKFEELKQPKRNERQVKKEKAKKEFKIEMVKIGKLEEKTAQQTYAWENLKIRKRRIR